jgi:hypothetical protein
MCRAGRPDNRPFSNPAGKLSDDTVGGLHAKNMTAAAGYYISKGLQ